MSPPVPRGEQSRSRRGCFRFRGKAHRFSAVLFTCGTTGDTRRVFACRSSWLCLPYDLARVGRAEPYLAYVAVIVEVVEFLRVHVLPAAARANNRGSEKRRVMHNGCCAVTVRITYNSRVPSSDDVNSSPVRSVIIPLWFVEVLRQCWINADPIGFAKHERSAQTVSN